MLNIKFVLVILLSLAGITAAYAAWRHRQHTLAHTVKQGAEKLYVPKQAEQIQKFKDR